MAKFYGNIGFANTVEDENSPGVWNEKIVEQPYHGDFISINRRLQSATNSVNDNITLSNQISIVANPYAMNNFYSIRYAVISGVKWKITDVQVAYPRLILSIGGLYNVQ